MRLIDIHTIRERVLIEPGIPPLVQECGVDLGWDTALQLPALHRLTAGLSGVTRRDHLLSSLSEPGEVYIHLDTRDQWPSPMQIINLTWFEHVDDELYAAVLAAIFDFYPRIREMYELLDENLSAATLPEITSPEELLPLIRLETIIVHDIDHASTPYLGFEFSCAWDEEHGLGLLTCGVEVLAISTADVSIDSSKAREHRERALAELA